MILGRIHPTPTGVVHGLMVLGADALSRWHQLPDQRRVAIWRAGAAVALLVFGLLVAFYQVVSGVVEQAALQRKMLARQAAETLRCNALPGQNARDHCLSRVRAPQAQAMQQAQAAIDPSTVQR